MNTYTFVSLIPLLPLLGFILLGIGGKNNYRTSAGLIATLVMGIAAALAIYTAWKYFFVNGTTGGIYSTITALKVTWLSFSDNVSIDLGIILDPISVMMLVVVTFVSFMVHLFSIGYMKGEERFSTYFSFLQLFTFSMLGLVVASNIFQIYMFWELVGLSSYLLIGFYYTRPSAVAAAKKAFIVTRFADLGFLIGILILSFHAGTLDFETLITRLSNKDSVQFAGITANTFLGFSLLTWALTLVFIGGAGKSAMFPLHIWLPDAMEGPTPVSALIHAATMVVAGVYLVARLFPLFHLNYVSQQMVTVIGLFSALIAAIIACTQTDIKRILAYSTMSQIGFMMFALGISGYEGESGLGYTASMFHLFTHAFFKSLLFLGAGAVIHFVHSNNMNDMGGLRKVMPVTHITFLIACLAISGIPPFAGFFSKEEILLAAWQSNKLVFYGGIITSCLTAFYMFRLYFSVFWKKAPAFDPGNEGGVSMKIPLIVLSICTVCVGFIPFSRFISAGNRSIESGFHLMFSIAPVLLSIAGIFTAYLFYKRENPLPSKVSAALGGLYNGAFNKFYIDEIYLFITKKIIFNLVGRPAAWIDRNIVDAMIVGTGTGTAKISEWIKGIQSGKVQNYAVYFFVGILGLTVFILYWWS
ncbi:MAG TPA: NADH-quinone oxidoreductase subunit L [Ferruginibacter sp.]|nr:NADH-quinone oxidoreductase subunit L [Ferruginibacter sp.]